MWIAGMWFGGIVDSCILSHVNVLIWIACPVYLPSPVSDLILQIKRHIDILGLLPKHISLKILCYLTPRQLLRISRVSIAPIALRKWQYTLQWRHNGRDGVSNHQPHDILINRLFRRRSKETPKLRVTGLCVGNSPATGEFPAQMASNAEMFPFDDVIILTV